MIRLEIGAKVRFGSLVWQRGRRDDDRNSMMVAIDCFAPGIHSCSKPRRALVVIEILICSRIPLYGSR